MRATEKQIARMQEEIEGHNEDIQALRAGAKLSAMGVPKGVSREEAIKGWTERRDAIQAALDKGIWFPM